MTIDNMQVQNIISLITLIAMKTYDEQALDCFEEMQFEGHSPNAATYVCILKACSIMESGVKQ